MARLIIEGFETIDDAKEYASWFEGQGEQDAFIWMEENDKPLYYSKNYDIDVEEDAVFLKVKNSSKKN